MLNCAIMSETLHFYLLNYISSTRALTSRPDSSPRFKDVKVVLPDSSSRFKDAKVVFDKGRR